MCGHVLAQDAHSPKRRRISQGNTHADMMEALVGFCKAETAERDSSHSHVHMCKVAARAKQIHPGSGRISQLAAAVAVCHDICDHKYYDDVSVVTLRIKQNLAPFFNEQDVSLILNVIDNISYSKEKKRRDEAAGETPEWPEVCVCVCMRACVRVCLTHSVLCQVKDAPGHAQHSTLSTLGSERAQTARLLRAFWVVAYDCVSVFFLRCVSASVVARALPLSLAPAGMPHALPCASLTTCAADSAFICRNKPCTELLQLGPDGQLVRNIVSDADKLEAIGREGVNRCMEYSRAKLKCEEPKLIQRLVEHCEEKLFLLLPHGKGTLLAPPLRFPLAHGDQHQHFIRVSCPAPMLCRPHSVTAQVTMHFFIFGVPLSLQLHSPGYFRTSKGKGFAKELHNEMVDIVADMLPEAGRAPLKLRHTL